jgi:hypothetical protein
MLGKSVFRGNITKVNPLFFFHNCPWFQHDVTQIIFETS